MWLGVEFATEVRDRCLVRMRNKMFDASHDSNSSIALIDTATGL